MIYEQNGNIFDNLPDYSIVVHQTNCLGIAGGGIALQIRKTFNGWFSKYYSLCFKYKDSPEKLLGHLQFFKVNSKFMICNAFCQNNIVNKNIKIATDYNAWERALTILKSQVRQSKNKWTIHIPYNIGCGLGGGDWNKMMAIFNKYFKESPIDVIIHKL